MTFKTNINNNPRTFIVAKGGDDTQSGQTFETAKLTLTAALAEVNALVPPSSISDPSAILTSGAGNFQESLILPDGCQFDGENIINFPATGSVFEPASQASFEILSAGVSSANDTVFRINNKTEVGVVSKAVVVLGAGGIGVHVLGSSDEIFITISQLTLSADNSIGILDQTNNGAPEVYNINELSLEADGTCGFRHDPTNPLAEAVLNAGLIGEIGSFVGVKGLLAGTKGVEVLNGILDAFVNTIKAVDAILISTPGTLNLISDRVIGDITVNGVLNCTINSHVGEITNNGIINGTINGVPFGSARQKPLEITELSAISTAMQQPSGLDSPLQIEFGSAQGSSNTPIELTVDGDILIHKVDQYKFRFFIQYGRTGSGGQSFLFFRFLIDGVQSGNSAFAKLDGTGDDLPLQIVIVMNLNAGQVVTAEIVRDSQGADSGGLIPETPTLGDWSIAPSASITVSRLSLVQALQLIAFLPGSSGDFFSTPDSAVSSITSDIDIQIRAAAADWTTTETILSKWEETGFQKSYLFQISSTGALRLFLSEDGAVTLGPATSSVVTGFSDDSLHWIRVTWDEATGDVDFFTSDDDTDDSTAVSWTALGTTQTLSPSGIFDSTADVEIGSHNSGTAVNFDGAVSRASILNGIGGTLVVDFNPQNYRGGSTFPSTLTEEVWTLNGNVSITI